MIFEAATVKCKYCGLERSAHSPSTNECPAATPAPEPVACQCKYCRLGYATGHKPEQAQPPAPEVREALRNLYRAYVNLLENGRERILFLGGQCDDVPTMEESDPALREARSALSKGDAK